MAAVCDRKQWVVPNSCVLSMHRCLVGNSCGQDKSLFFSSRRRHTRCSRDWSSDVCSSDLTSAFDLSTSSLPLDGSASSRIIRIDSAIRGQYYTDYQWQVWSYSSCSGISMEEEIGRASCRERV